MHRPSSGGAMLLANYKPRAILPGVFLSMERGQAYNRPQ